ncbi:MAG TPA: TadE/TadG family type IV pilus assembly protein [Terriglobales bacterium]|nr:TadE/TadG family type IV pilus assembly protein [Terriglobales bacterium]
MRRAAGIIRRWLGREEASSLAEFAVSLPLLVVLVVGIFDFGGAFNQKQELNNAVREGARFGAAQPTNDLCPPAGTTSCNAPPSVDAIRVLVDSYLTAAQLNDCGLSTLTPPSGTDPVWTYAASGNGCPGQLTLTIIRGYSPTTSQSCNLQTNTTPVVNIPCTQVTISYPYAWHFNSVIQLIAPGSSFALSTITTSATAVNMD